VAPAAAAMRLGASTRAQLWLAAALGSGAGVLGLVVSAELDLAAGGSVALAAIALYALAAIVRPGGHDGGPRRSPVEALGAQS
jgi:ABC-type Mn2+/Zn2+ transport system permease subunit